MRRLTRTQILGLHLLVCDPCYSVSLALVGQRVVPDGEGLKKPTRRGDVSGGYDSGDGSDDFSPGRRKGYDCDESDGAQKRKKEGLTRDYLETVRKTPLLASPGELI